MNALEHAEQALAKGTLLALRPQDIRVGDVLLNVSPEPLTITTKAWMMLVGHGQYEVAVIAGDAGLVRLPDTQETTVLAERTTPQG